MYAGGRRAGREHGNLRHFVSFMPDYHVLMYSESLQRVVQGATGDCSLRKHSYRATSETKARTWSPQTQLVTTSSDEMVTLDLRLACTIWKWRLGGGGRGRGFSDPMPKFVDSGHPTGHVQEVDNVHSSMMTRKVKGNGDKPQRTPSPKAHRQTAPKLETSNRTGTSPSGKDRHPCVKFW